MPFTGERKKHWRRAYTACNRWLLRVRPDVVPYLDQDERLTIRMTAPLKWGEAYYRNGEVYTLHWTRAVRLLAGYFAELAATEDVAPEPSGTEADPSECSSLVAKLHTAGRLVAALTRAARKGAIHAR